MIGVVLLAIGGTSVVIFRKIMSAVNKSSVTGMINSLRKNPANAIDIVEILDIPYGKRESFSVEEFELLRTAVRGAASVGDFSILHHVEVDAFQHLVITEVVYSDFDVDITGKPTDIKKRAYHSFALRFNSSNRTLTVWSDLHNDMTSKFQKEAFSRSMVNSPVKSA